MHARDGGRLAAGVCHVVPSPDCELRTAWRPAGRQGQMETIRLCHRPSPAATVAAGSGQRQEQAQTARLAGLAGGTASQHAAPDVSERDRVTRTASCPSVLRRVLRAAAAKASFAGEEVLAGALELQVGRAGTAVGIARPERPRLAGAQDGGA